MATYSEQISKIGDLRMQDVIGICKSQLPDEYKNRPYRHPELQNGVALLQSEDGLNCYISAYGEMHMIKCRAALQNFPFHEIQGTVEIVDWGCGQGIGSLCTLEALSEQDKLQWLKRITLIEPSNSSRNRAEINITRATNGTIPTIPIERYLPCETIDNEIVGLDYYSKYVIHIFSNILDINSINLFKLAQIVACPDKNHFVLCIGPVNANSYRIEQFCSVFGEQLYFSNINDRQYGRTSDTFYTFTCKTKCFHYNGNPLNISNLDKVEIPVFDDNNIIYSEYDPRSYVQNGIISKELSKLYLTVLNQLSPNDIILVKPDINGDKPDLVVVRPQKGVLIISLFEEDLNNFDSTNENKLSPIDILDTYQMNLIRLHIEGMLEKVITNPANFKLIKKLLFCTKCNTEEARKQFGNHSNNNKYTYVYGNNLLDNNNVDLFKDIYFNIDNTEFDDINYKSFLGIITPKWHSCRQGDQISLTTIQKNLSQSTASKQQKISGVAGAGKTQVLATRAVNAQVRTGGNVLVLTYNKTLRNYMKQRINEVRADFFWNKIHIDNYHQFFKNQALNFSLSLKLNSFEDETFFENSEEQLQKYEAILIDEVQDYKSEWLKILNRYFLSKNGEFVVFGDPKQNLYGRPIDKKGDINLGIIGGEWNKQLKEGKRFSNPQITKLATDFQRVFLSLLPTDDFGEIAQTTILSKIEYDNIGVGFTIRNLSEQLLQLITEKQLEIKETVILSQTAEVLRDLDYSYRKTTNKNTKTTFIQYEEFHRLMNKYKIDDKSKVSTNFKFKKDKDAIEHQKRMHFTMEDDLIKLSTIHSYKGWEAQNVIVILESEGTVDYCVPANLNSPEIIYTAITRAKESLFVINLGNTKYHSFFEKSIRNKF